MTWARTERLETRVTPAAVSEDDLRKRKLADVHGCVLVMRWSRSTRGGYAGLCKNMTALLPPDAYDLEVAGQTIRNAGSGHVRFRE